MTNHEITADQIAATFEKFQPGSTFAFRRAAWWGVRDVFGAYFEEASQEELVDCHEAFEKELMKFYVRSVGGVAHA